MDIGEITAEPLPRHPWEVVRARFFLQRLTEFHALNASSRVLDVGAGDGYVAGLLATRAAEVVAFDPHYEEPALSRVRGATPDVRFVSTPPEGRFDLVLLLDVLEHVQDDRAALAKLLTGSLADRGWLLVSVPAWPHLFTRHDVRVGHCRRYRPAELRRLVEQAGLRVVVEGGLYPTLLPVRAAETLVERARGLRPRPEPHRVEAPTGAAQFGGPAWMRQVVTTVLGLDARLCGAMARRRLNLPGLSSWLLARREPTS